MNKYNKHINHSASLLKSVGHPIRLSIILCLSDYEHLTVTELSDLLSIDQPVMSLHLGVLRRCNVIKVEKVGKNSMYSTSNISIKQIVSIVCNAQKFISV